jgi:hypothetical protein
MSYPDSHPGYKDAKSPCNEQPRCCDADVLDDDPVNHPSHYTYGTIEAKDYINSCGFGEGFNLGNAIKYITRCGRKGEKIRDLHKAIAYLRFEIERERMLSE